VAIQEGGLGCEQVADDEYAGSVVLVERGECDFVTKVSDSIHRGATPYDATFTENICTSTG
jgi:hypothetical protein